MTDVVVLPVGSQADVNPWLVAAVVIIPTFMEVLDTTIAVVALRYIAGGLSATVDDGEWVITSYLAGHRLAFGASWSPAVIAVFTLASGLCGMATSLVCRAWQGAVFSLPVRACCWTPFRWRSKAS